MKSHIVFMLTLAVMSSAGFGVTYTLSDPSGLSALVEFKLIDSTTLEVALRNTSTGTPPGFSNSDQLLTGVSFDTGALGVSPGDPDITDGTVRIADSSHSVNFDTGDYDAPDDVSGEWGYGNSGGSGHLPNLIVAMAAQSTPFGDVNLDGPHSLDGPQAGLVSAAMTDPIDLGGLGAIQDQVIIRGTLDRDGSDLAFLDPNLVRVEFGSDAAFVTTPEPATLALAVVAGLLCLPSRGRAHAARLLTTIAVAVTFSAAYPAGAATTYTLTDPNGLGAEVTFTWLDGHRLEIALKNISTGVPSEWIGGENGNSNQLLTGVSFDLGLAGVNPGDPAITSGTVKIGPTSQSMNFDTGVYDSGDDVSGEWGYGNSGGSGHLPNLVVAMSAQSTPFGNDNLDGPDSLDGPQCGLIAASMPEPLGGLAAIKDQVIITLTLDRPVDDLGFLANDIRVEFGSDAYFLPEPATFVLTALAACLYLPSRRR